MQYLSAYWEGVRAQLHHLFPHFCTGFRWGRVTFLNSSLYGAMFWICADDNVDNTGMF